MRTATTILLGLVLVTALACGDGAPPDLPVAAWLPEAENDSPRWRAAEEWCDGHPDHARCQPVLRAKGELVLRKLIHAAPPPDYDEGNHLPVVPEGIEEITP